MARVKGGHDSSHMGCTQCALIGGNRSCLSGMLLRGYPNHTTTAVTPNQAANLRQYHQVAHHRLPGYALIRAQLKSSVAACAEWCTDTPNCASFNYKTSATVCQLSSAGHPTFHPAN